MMWFIFPGMVTISYKGTDVFVDIFRVEKSYSPAIIAAKVLMPIPILMGIPKNKTTRNTVNIINDILLTGLCLVLFRYSVSLMLLRMGKPGKTAAPVSI